MKRALLLLFIYALMLPLYAKPRPPYRITKITSNYWIIQPQYKHPLLSNLLSIPARPLRIIRKSPFAQFGNPNPGNAVFNNIRYVNPGTTGDVSALVNAAVILQNKGQVIIAPGTYNTSTTMNCADSNPIFGYGTRINYTGTGTASLCANEGHAGIRGIQWVGPGTGGATICLQVGIGTGGLNIDTAYNDFQDLQCNAFNKGLVLEGSSMNGTYGNTFLAINNTSNNINFFLVPTAPNFANFNAFFESNSVTSVSDGWRIDGANGNMCFACRSETSGAWGFNFTGVSATNSTSFLGVWGEGNTSGDFNCASAANVTNLTVWGGKVISSPNFSANCFISPGSSLAVSNVWNNFVNGINAFNFEWNATLGASNAFTMFNAEGAPTFNNVFALNRTGAGAGNGAGSLFAGTNEYPLTLRGPIVISGVAPTVTGTGTCATSNTPLGGETSGSIVCTGASGAATITFTFAATAPNFYWCDIPYDKTTPGDLFTRGATTNTSCSFNAAALVANDVIVFRATAY